MLIIIHWLKTNGWYRNHSYNALVVTMVVEFYFVSTFPRLFGVLCGALEKIKRKKKIVATVVRELTLFSMYRGLK